MFSRQEETEKETEKRPRIKRVLKKQKKTVRQPFPFTRKKPFMKRSQNTRKLLQRKKQTRKKQEESPFRFPV